ncbi:hypothetical protein GCM10017635_32010 [Paracoccus kondratievae]|uniref:Uncharacterized protein n=1 Tax=Paracoccus kondratievae TaxID=135740 RepID=A0AAD3P1C9_9RHOB|nr:hypothetical protein GCM10017635_32010 [Paracoccus kondratievae]
MHQGLINQCNRVWPKGCPGDRSGSDTESRIVAQYDGELTGPVSDLVLLVIRFCPLISAMRQPQVRAAESMDDAAVAVRLG